MVTFSILLILGVSTEFYRVCGDYGSQKPVKTVFTVPNHPSTNQSDLLALENDVEVDDPILTPPHKPSLVFSSLSDSISGVPTVCKKYKLVSMDLKNKQELRTIGFKDKFHIIPPITFRLDDKHLQRRPIEITALKYHRKIPEYHHVGCCNIKSNRSTYHPEGSSRSSITVKEIHTTLDCTCMMLIGEVTSSNANEKCTDGQNNKSVNCDGKRRSAVEEVVVHVNFTNELPRINDPLQGLWKCSQHAIGRKMEVGLGQNETTELGKRVPRGTFASSNLKIFPSYRYKYSNDGNGNQNVTVSYQHSSTEDHGSEEGNESDAGTSSEKDEMSKIDPDDDRSKRQMHVIMTRYRKELKTKVLRKKRSNPTVSCSGSKSNVRTTPYTFLNVSFTGYYERMERTTMRPRVQNPLKMSTRDFAFVYEEPKPKIETRVEAVLGNYFSHVKVNVNRQY